VHLRRAVLLFAIVLGLTAIASSVAPPPREATRNGAPATTEAPAPAPAPPEPIRTLGFEYPVPGSRPRSVTLEKGAHVVIAVRANTPGEAAVPRLGLTDDADPDTPASFDVLISDDGRYDVLFAPVSGGAPSRLGTLVVGE
jgi:hypothetical protein